MGVLSQISEALQKGQTPLTKGLCQKALNESFTAREILEDGLMNGMGIIGAKFKKNEVFVPEVLIASRAMNAGIEILKPLMINAGIESARKVVIGKVVIGTVKGDLHDIGKNLVKIMMEGKGFKIIDLGTDVSAETFLKTAKAEHANIVCCSALLTTTMTYMKDIVNIFDADGSRDNITIMIGGAPITRNFCHTIGADIYSPDAATAADAALGSLVSQHWKEEKTHPVRSVHRNTR